MPRAQETVLEINLKALTHNFIYLKSRLRNDQKFLAVVKAFAYGSDAEVIAKHLQDLNVDYFAVAYSSEGVALRESGITKPIMVLHPLSIHFNTIIDYCLEPVIYNSKTLDGFLTSAKKKYQKDYPIHLNFNTGLNRLGFGENDIDFILSKINPVDTLNVISIFSHLAASEDLNEKTFTKKQIDNFIKIATEYTAKTKTTPLRHLCNTSGILNYPEAHLDMVRSGIGLYGFGNSTKENANLKPIANLKSVISQIHEIKPNESVGYNRAYKATLFEKIATIPIGHADGLGRQYGNRKGFVYINSQKAQIIGNVCMDMIMVDITAIACKEGDEVVIFDATNTAENLAGATGTISYELITSISQRIKRTFIK